MTLSILIYKNLYCGHKLRICLHNLICGQILLIKLLIKELIKLNVLIS